jgi:hypothetical protein
MKDNKKQRLVEIMQAIDKSFKPKMNETIDDDWSFYSKNVEANIYGLKQKFYPQAEYVSAYHQKVNVKWHIIPEFRDYGIKSMMIMIDGIEGTIYYEIASSDENLPDQEEQLDVGKYQWKFNTKIDNRIFGDSVYPTEVEIDFTTMKCEVIF